jgi:DEAD/DEAH box helicase domain-containing protein
MSFPTPVQIADDLRAAFLRYIDTAYALRNPDLIEERRRLLLEGQGNLFAPLMLEPVLPYDGVTTVEDCAAAIDVDPRDLWDVVRSVFGVAPDALPSIKLRKHQAAALGIHFEDGGTRNPVVTSGTGSGKTEAFLIPMLTRIAVEKRSSKALTPVHEWWDIRRQNELWRPTRTVDTAPAALRSMVLYPTNALVEDQVARLGRCEDFVNEPTRLMCGSADTQGRPQGQAASHPAERQRPRCRALPETCAIFRASMPVSPR